MTVAPLTYIKLRMLQVWWERNRPDDVPAPTDNAKIDSLQGVLDQMGGSNRWYYAQTLKAMSAFVDHKFDEVRRPRERKPDFWAGTLDGVMLVAIGGASFAGQLRYRLKDALRSEAEDADVLQINQLINYMRSFETSRGNLAVHRYVNSACGRQIPPEVWTNIQQHFSPEEIVEVNASGWLERVDTPE